MRTNNLHRASAPTVPEPVRNRITGKKKLVIIDVLNASGDDVYAQNAVKDR